MPPFRIQTSGVILTPIQEERTRRLVSRRLARFGTLVGRVDVRFEDVNGPRGGADTVARIHLPVAGRPPVFAQGRARDADRALARALSSVAAAMNRTTGRRGLRVPAPTRVAVEPGSRATAARAEDRRRARPARGARRTSGMVYRHEASATKPSRKSTRKSANRAKGASRLSRRTRHAKHTPRKRAARAQSQRRRAQRGR
jgi:hypothetical protein